MTETNNLELWQVVEKTPLDQQKKITGKAYNGNSPKPHYLVHKATETFGPCGIGWGFSILDEKLMDGALLEPGFYEKIHMVRIKVWYVWGKKSGEVEHVGQTLFCGKRKNGNAFTDEDAPKKSVTDALTKALSMIGFAGDIFMGRYEDSKYLQELREDAQEQQAPSSNPQYKPPTPEQKEAAGSVKAAIMACKTVKALKDLAATPLFGESVNALHPELANEMRREWSDRKAFLADREKQKRIEASNDELTGDPPVGNGQTPQSESMATG